MLETALMILDSAGMLEEIEPAAEKPEQRGAK